jgi:Uncharacterized conserved protein
VTFDALEPGSAYELVNDHDPKPLYYQFVAEHAGAFSWDYLEQSPEVWRVQIGRTSDATVDPPERFCDGCKAAGGSGTTARQP